MSTEQIDVAQAERGKAVKRTPRSIRFYDSEWERIEAFAEKRGVAAAEYVRFAALAAIEGGAGVGDAEGRLAPLIERTFRYAYMMATKMRDEMLEAGRDEEIQVLIREARALQNELLGGASD